ncbi:MAG: PadR family transcriptional regulator [Gemmatimonadota bacterium]|jgi:DNA-binding PadR family transcriptional regulator
MTEILTDLAFNILVALAERDLHGYALVKQLREMDGRASLRTGTVYAALARLEDAGWISTVAGHPGEDVDDRRRYYRVTADGLQAARGEAVRLAAILDRAGDRGLLPDGSGA